jgi:hypothetical protein
MKYIALPVFCLLSLSACDRAPQQSKNAAASGGAAKHSAIPLTNAMAMAEVYGNVDPASTTSVWTRPDPAATEPASFDSVDGIAAQVAVASLTPLGTERALLITAARDENPETGQIDGCKTCPVILSAYIFERDAAGWRVIERQDAVAKSTETQLSTAIKVQLQNNGGADVTLAGGQLRFGNDGRLLSRLTK